MKIGLDVHGVVDKYPDVFARLTKVLKGKGHEIIIITGRELCTELFDKLDTLGVAYNDVFSITSYHKRIGTHVTYKDGDPTQPLIAPPLWDRTKADFCKQEGVAVHFDDSLVYGKYFEEIDTQYILVNEGIAEVLRLILEGAVTL